MKTRVRIQSKSQEVTAIKERHVPAIFKSGEVALVGRPNSGKSTLLNAVMGTKISIVSSKPQTTRERVLGILTSEQGQILFSDTPGIHQARAGGVNEFMVDQAAQSLLSADLIWVLVAPDSKIKAELKVLELMVSVPEVPFWIIETKTDLGAPGLGSSVVEEFKRMGVADSRLRLFSVSAKSKQGLPHLLQETWNQLPEGPAYYPDPTQMSDRPTKFFLGELVREQLFRQLGEELPYSCAVHVESVQEQTKPMRIAAKILVERDSQKPMVIGAGGQKVKSIGTDARLEIQKFLGEPVFLGLKVEVLKDWTKNSAALRRLGYVLPDRKKELSK